ncbi:hypothetical protein ASE40_21610 [Flavobacterium sp. Root935]|jgi:hypothetical protein|uniref:hypothetical protein n=1 Tax=Flavobacterium sp. Root935 TaxID=1736610 RepID=UPI00070CDF68|nr:hypothetical protein [Flavobacterium sp. Root935]KRD63491.1 hypothetical protein ASE40_21610 [Flavobacterium sp. Root935]
MQKIDLYSEYTGELSIVLNEKTSNNLVIFEVKILQFHFNEVLSLIPSAQYNKESVMYNYFKCEGWYDGQWECKRKEEFKNQLLLIENNVPQNLLHVYNAIKQICASSIQNNNQLFIELE